MNKINEVARIFEQREVKHNNVNIRNVFRGCEGYGQSGVKAVCGHVCLPVVWFIFSDVTICHYEYFSVA